MLFTTCKTPRPKYREVSLKGERESWAFRAEGSGPRPGFLEAPRAAKRTSRKRREPEESFKELQSAEAELAAWSCRSAKAGSGFAGCSWRAPASKLGPSQSMKKQTPRPAPGSSHLNTSEPDNGCYKMPREDTFCPDSRHRLRLLGILTESREFRIPPQSPRVLMRMAVRAAKDGEPNFTQCLQLLSCRSETGIEMLSDLSFSAGWKSLQWTLQPLDDLGPPAAWSPSMAWCPTWTMGPRDLQTHVPPVKLPASAGQAQGPSELSQIPPELSWPRTKDKILLQSSRTRPWPRKTQCWVPDPRLVSEALPVSATPHPRDTTGRNGRGLSPFCVEYAARLEQGETFPGQGA